MRSAPDGNTLWLTSVGAAAINPSLYEKLPYDMQRDFAPVSLVVNNVELLVVNPTDPAKDAAEFVANSKKRKDPTPMASSGIGSIPHLAIEQLTRCDRRQAAARAVQGRGAGDHRRDGRPGRRLLRRRSRPDRPCARRQAQGPRHRVEQAPSVAARRARRWRSRASRASTPTTGTRCSRRRRHRRRRVDALNKAVRKALAARPCATSCCETGAEPAPSTPAGARRTAEARYRQVGASSSGPRTSRPNDEHQRHSRPARRSPAHAPSWPRSRAASWPSAAASRCSTRCC